MKYKIKKFLFFIMVAIMILQVTTMSFASYVTLNKTKEELIQYDKDLEEKARKQLNNSQLENDQNIPPQEIELTPYTASDDGTEQTEEPTFADFTNASVSFEFDSSNIAMYISNFQPIAQNYYYVYIGTDEATLSTENFDSRVSASSIKDQNKLKATLDNKYMALNKEYYYILTELSFTSRDKFEQIQLKGKVVRPELPPVGSRIDVFMVTKGQCSPFLYAYNTSEYSDRKIKYKISKVTDTNLLKKFKTNEGQAFKELLTYAKNSSGITSGTIDSKVNPIDSVKLDKDGYYCAYLYIDDVNGKYYPIEDVQIYEETNGTLCHFAFGDMHFSDDEIDNTSSPTELPYAGAVTVSAFIIVSILAVILIFIINKKYEDVK